jgi:hypothetical protein
MAREGDGLGRADEHTDCPLQCWRRRGNAPDHPSSSQTWARDHVDWAGLPVNLDLAFSPQHRDKVYAQHMMRKRGAQLWRWLPRTAALCVCGASAERFDADVAKDYV